MNEKIKFEAETKTIENEFAESFHHAKIHNEILQDLQKFVSTEKAKEIIKAIHKSKIKNLKITY